MLSVGTMITFSSDTWKMENGTITALAIPFSQLIQQMWNTGKGLIDETDEPIWYNNENRNPVQQKVVWDVCLSERD
jgi:hypothetical protein